MTGSPSTAIRLLQEPEQRSTQLLTANQAELRAVVDLLMEKETISGDELTAVVRRPVAESTPTPR